MKAKLEQITKNALEAIEAATSVEHLTEVKVSFLGKKGELSKLLKGMKDVAPEDRPKVGQMVNEARAKIEEQREQNIVDLLRRCFNRIAEFLCVLLNNQKNVDGQADPKCDRDDRISGVVEFVRQWASIGQVNLAFAGAMVFNLAHIQLEVVEVLNECAFDIHTINASFQMYCIVLCGLLCYYYRRNPAYANHAF